MAKKLNSRRRGHAHEQHLVLVQQCPRCARWVVLVGQVAGAGSHDLPTPAHAEATQLLAAITGKPDPDPLLVTVLQPGHAVATGLSPVESVAAPAAA